MSWRLNPDGVADRSRQGREITEHVDCPLCGRGSSEVLATVRGHYSDDSFVVRRCALCGLVFVSPRLSSAFRAFCYRNETHLVDWFLSTAGEARADARRALDLLGAVGVSKGELLEVGCGLGVFMEEALARGFQVTGIELNRGLAEHVRKSLEVIEDDFLEMALPAGRFDVIVMEQTLEHLADPLEALKRASAALRVGGFLYVSVPTFDSLALVLDRLAGPKSPLWSPEDHLYYFRPRAMARLMVEAGLEPVKVPYRSVFRRAADALSLSSGVYMGKKA